MIAARLRNVDELTTETSASPRVAEKFDLSNAVELDSATAAAAAAASSDDEGCRDACWT